MKKILIIFISIFIGLSMNIFSATVTVKVKDNCTPANGKKCKVGSSGGISISVADYKNKNQQISHNLNPEDLNSSEYTIMNHFYIPNPDNCDIGVGVINGLLYMPSNPLNFYYYWIYDNSNTYTNYSDWKNAYEQMFGPGSAPSNCSVVN